MIDGIPLRKRPTAVAAMVRQIVALMDPYAKDEGIAMSVEVDAAAPAQLTIDEDKVAWAVGTLIGNALRHVPKKSLFHQGGQIVVRVSKVQGTGDIVIEVSDNGPGIPPDKLALLFQPAPYQRRVGYALILAREIAEAHGGTLDVVSSQEPFGQGGTTVRLVLPGDAAERVPSGGPD
jgi:signal transduction histidine kinase